MAMSSWVSLGSGLRRRAMYRAPNHYFLIDTVIIIHCPGRGRHSICLNGTFLIAFKNNIDMGRRGLVVSE